MQEALRSLWSDEQPELYQHGIETALELQGRYGLTLPSEFEEYVETSLPSSIWWGPYGFQFWNCNSLTNLLEEQDATPARYRRSLIWDEAEHYVVFADYLDRCYDYAICCSDGPNRGKVALVGHCPNRLVASSLSEFIGLAGNNSDRVHSPVGDPYGDVA